MTDESKSLPLFREKAIEAFATRSYGRPIAKMPNSWIYLSSLLISMVIIACWFLTSSNYSRKESVVGWLAPTEGLVRISVTQSGQIEELLAEQGSSVQKGDVLFVFSQDRKRVSGAGETVRLLEKLEQDRLEIERQIVIELATQESDVKQAGLLIDQLMLEITQVGTQLVQQEKRVEIQNEILERYLKLGDAATFLEVQAQKERLLFEQQAATTFSQRKSTLSRELINARNILTKRPLESQRIVSELRRRFIDIENRKTEYEIVASQAIQSPIDGTIASLEVKVGNFVYPQELIATVVPSNTDLYAEVYIPSRAIGFVKSGQSVRIMYAAFPYQSFGAATGSVFEISDSILMADEVPSSVGLEEPAYKVKIDLDDQVMEGFGEVLALKPGMNLRAEIILEQRSFLEWILEPLRARRTG